MAQSASLAITRQPNALLLWAPATACGVIAVKLTSRSRSTFKVEVELEEAVLPSATRAVLTNPLEADWSTSLAPAWRACHTEQVIELATPVVAGKPPVPFELLLSSGDEARLEFLPLRSSTAAGELVFFRLRIEAHAAGTAIAVAVVHSTVFLAFAKPNEAMTSSGAIVTAVDPSTGTRVTTVYPTALAWARSRSNWRADPDMLSAASMRGAKKRRSSTAPESASAGKERVPVSALTTPSPASATARGAAAAAASTSEGEAAPPPKRTRAARSKPLVAPSSPLRATVMRPFREQTRALVGELCASDFSDSSRLALERVAADTELYGAGVFTRALLSGPTEDAARSYAQLVKLGQMVGDLIEAFTIDPSESEQADDGDGSGSGSVSVVGGADGACGVEGAGGVDGAEGTTGGHREFADDDGSRSVSNSSASAGGAGTPQQQRAKMTPIYSPSGRIAAITSTPVPPAPRKAPRPDNPSPLWHAATTGAGAGAGAHSPMRDTGKIHF